MPTASAQTMADMEKIFPNIKRPDYIPEDCWHYDTAAESFLKSRGFILSDDWCWYIDRHKTIEDLSHYEYTCVAYLMEDWDYGPVIFGPAPETPHR